MQAYDRLGSYGVKARLQTLWRDAHSMLSGADKQSQRQKPHHSKKKAKPCEAAQTDAQTDAAASKDALASSHMTNVSEQPSDFVNAQQQAAFAVCNSYIDLFLPNQPYPIRQVLLRATLRWCACLANRLLLLELIAAVFMRTVCIVLWHRFLDMAYQQPPACYFHQIEHWLPCVASCLLYRHVVCDMQV